MTVFDFNGYQPRTESDDTLWLSPGQVTVSLELRRTSALEDCTTVDGDGSGRVSIARNWPGLSSGEERLWAVLAYINGHGQRPDMDDLLANLDGPNFEAAYVAVTS